MAISITSLTSGTDTDGGSSSATASITPSSNKLILLSVYSRTGITAEPNEPTVSGNGLTWVKINGIYFDTTSSSRKKITLFRAMGSSPSTGAITINFAGQNQTDVYWMVEEVTGMETSGTNGSGAIIQSATRKEESWSGGTITATLAAFASTDNATFGTFLADRGAGTSTVGSGFTALQRIDDSFNNMLDEYKNTNDTSVDATFDAGTGLSAGGIAIEIKAAAVASTIKSLASLGVG